MERSLVLTGCQAVQRPGGPFWWQMEVQFGSRTLKHFTETKGALTFNFCTWSSILNCEVPRYLFVINAHSVLVRPTTVLKFFRDPVVVWHTILVIPHFIKAFYATQKYLSTQSKISFGNLISFVSRNALMAWNPFNMCSRFPLSCF